MALVRGVRWAMAYRGRSAELGPLARAARSAGQWRASIRGGLPAAAAFPSPADVGRLPFLGDWAALDARRRPAEGRGHSVPGRAR